MPPFILLPLLKSWPPTKPPCPLLLLQPQALPVLATEQLRENSPLEVTANGVLRVHRLLAINSPNFRVVFKNLICRQLKLLIVQPFLVACLPWRVMRKLHLTWPQIQCHRLALQIY